MQRRTTIGSSTVIIILSMITILVQFAAYYFFPAYIAIWSISCLISIICCHILLEQTSAYVACSNYSVLTIFISLLIIIITYFGDVKTFLPYSSGMLGIALINWLIPMLHCFIRNMLEYGARIDDFRDFYLSSSIVFLIFYIGIVIYGNFAEGAFPWAYHATAGQSGFSPFCVISAQIEDYLYKSAPLSNITVYLMSRILTYIPYGFYIILFLNKKKRLTRFFAILAAPLFIEVLQYFIIRARFDVDDFIYAVIGSLLGFFTFFLINIIYRAFSGRNFTMLERNARNNQLHF